MGSTPTASIMNSRDFWIMRPNCHKVFPVLKAKRSNGPLVQNWGASGPIGRKSGTRTRNEVFYFDSALSHRRGARTCSSRVFPPGHRISRVEPISGGLPSTAWRLAACIFSFFGRSASNLTCAIRTTHPQTYILLPLPLSQFLLLIQVLAACSLLDYGHHTLSPLHFIHSLIQFLSILPFLPVHHFYKNFQSNRDALLYRCRGLHGWRCHSRPGSPELRPCSRCFSDHRWPGSGSQHCSELWLWSTQQHPGGSSNHARNHASDHCRARGPHYPGSIYNWVDWVLHPDSCYH